MNAFIKKAILLTLILFLTGNAQELPECFEEISPFEWIGCPVQREPHGHIKAREPDISGDTLKLKSDEAYAVFSGSLFQRSVNNDPDEIFTDIRVKSIIRGNIDTTNHPSILLNLEWRCPNINIKMNKDYLVLSFIVFTRDPHTPNLECEDVLIDTPKNRHKLIKKYNGKIVVPSP
jgi:hypothetical protein